MKYKKLIMGEIIIVFILFSGCVANNQNINNNTKKEQSVEETSRDRTPGAPRINIPSHTF